MKNFSSKLKHLTFKFIYKLKSKLYLLSFNFLYIYIYCQGKSIGLVGGDNAVSSTRKLMATMLSPNLAQKVNWTGKNEKLPFSEMNGIRQIVYG